MVSKRNILISNFDKKVGFAKEIKRLSNHSPKLPSISAHASPSRILDEDKLLPSPLNPSFHSVF